ncbi:MAG: SU10 major capsid protein [Bacteroidales bacterium]
MAVLKSFELNGNKQSLANWISNLSPCDTPFSSMIGKQGINESQYSWQTDALAPPTKELHEDGSVVEFQPRESTAIHTNFTSTLRKVVSVTETAMALSLRGRNDEFKYQLQKASKEMKRDLEFMNLGTDKGRVGTHNKASRFSGFLNLCAPINGVDPDTKAITTKEVIFHDLNGPWFTLKQIFEITYGLYMSGSKADKIMFHPKHVQIFSDVIGFNEEDAQVYRLFDTMDTKMNMQVAKIKDPLGRVYILIPNRFMPENKVYIFNESDWTQTVLRSPQRSLLGKTGSSETQLVEMEVGLRHRHPYASGVLSLVNTDKIAHLSGDRLILTAYTGDDDEVLDVLVTELDDITPIADVTLNWEVSDPTVMELIRQTGTTASDGSGDAEMVTHKPGTVNVFVRGHKMLSNLVTVEVREPIMNLTLDRHTMEIGERITATTKVTRHVTDEGAADGIVVQWHSDSDEVVFFSDPAGTTSQVTNTPIRGGNGETIVYIASKDPGTYNIWSSVNGIASKKQTIYVGGVDLKVEFTKNIPTFILGQDLPQDFSVKVETKDGVSVGSGATVKWISSDDNRMAVNPALSVTDANGVAKTEVTPLARGNVTIRAYAYGDEASCPVRIIQVGATANVTPDVVIVDPNNKTATIGTHVTDADGKNLQGALVKWKVEPGNLVELTSTQDTTLASGQAATTVKGLIAGDATLITTVGNREVRTQFHVGKGGIISLVTAPNPSDIGGEFTLRGRVTDTKGTAIQNQIVTFHAEGQTWKPGDTNSNATGSYESTATADKSGIIKLDAICASVGASTQINHTVSNQPVNVNVRVSRHVTTAGVGQKILLEAEVTTKTKGSVAGLDISVIDPNGKFKFSETSGVTDANGKWVTDMIVIGNPGDSTTLHVECEGNDIPVAMSIKSPVIEVETSPNPTLVGTSFATTVSAFLEDGITPVGKDIDVGIEVTPDELPEFNQTVYKTDRVGEVVILAVMKEEKDYAIQASIGSVPSNKVIQKPASLTVDVTSLQSGPMTILDGLGRDMRVKAQVGTISFPNATVAVTLSNDAYATLTLPQPAKTNANGEYTFKVKPRGQLATFTATVVITDTTTGKTATKIIPLSVANPIVKVYPANPTMVVHTEMKIDVELRTANNALPMVGKVLKLTCNPIAGAVLPGSESKTGADGKMDFMLAPINGGIHKLTGAYGALKSAVVDVTVIGN